MKSGRLVEIVVVERRGFSVNDAGTPVAGDPYEVATLRAERVSQGLVDRPGPDGARVELTVVFRVRFSDRVKVSDRLAWNNQLFEITRVEPIGRRKGLDLECMRIDR